MLASISGVASVNTIFDVPVLRNYHYIARLYDNDYFLPDHLLHIASCHAVLRVDFVHTSAFLTPKETNPFPFSKVKDIYIDNKFPGYGSVFHSSVSWRTNLHLYYRALDQIINSMSEFASDLIITPSDGDLWTRLKNLIKSGSLTSAFHPEVSVVHDDSVTPPKIFD